MKKVLAAGNMPSHVAAFAKQLQGNLSGQKETEFWEMSSIDEFEKKASEVGYEIIPAMDMKTNRGYLVGFDVEESTIVGPGGQTYAQLKMYFVECDLHEFESWVKKIKQHRDLQQEDYYLRQGR